MVFAMICVLFDQPQITHSLCWAPGSSAYTAASAAALTIVDAVVWCKHIETTLW